MDPIVARKVWRTLEPYHGYVYFAPEVAARYQAMGAVGMDGYFASRSAPMGAVAAEVVVATFFNFEPGLVGRSVPKVWELAAPHHWIVARLEGIDAALVGVLGVEAVESEGVERAAALARAAADSCRTEGRPLAAAHAGLPWPDQAHLALWHAVSVLREHRGDGHIAALVDARLSGCEALVLHAASGEVPRRALQGTRQWPDEGWDAAVAALADRGLVDAAGELTPQGRELRQHIEDRTDAMAVQPWSTIGVEGCDELRTLVRPMSKAIVEGGTFGIR